MTRNKFMKKHCLKLMAAIMTSFYGLTLVSPNIIKANPIEEEKATKNIEGDKRIGGTDTSKDKVKINGEVYSPTITYNKAADNKAVYSFAFEGVDLTFDISLEVVNNYLEMKLLNVVEGAEFALNTLEFIEYDLVTVNADEAVGKLTAAKINSINKSEDIYGCKYSGSIFT